jgi:isopentenyl phosphate kinase
MKAKIETLLNETEVGMESLIVDGRKKGNLKNALLGKKFLGTKVMQ